MSVILGYVGIAALFALLSIWFSEEYKLLKVLFLGFCLIYIALTTVTISQHWNTTGMATNSTLPNVGMDFGIMAIWIPLTMLVFLFFVKLLWNLKKQSDRKW